jgi:hypothetical protein
MAFVSACAIVLTCNLGYFIPFAAAPRFSKRADKEWRLKNCGSRPVKERGTC